MVELSTTFHTQIVGSNGQRQAMFIERVSGLADQILANFAFGPKDVLIVIGVTSRKHSASSESATGVRLMDVADLVIDICTDVGDALISIPDFETPVGPGSTVTTVAIVNEIKVQTAELLVQRGIRPPVLTSPAIVGKERSMELFDNAYDEHSVRIARVLGGIVEARPAINGLKK